jgi:plastocyanin
MRRLGLIVLASTALAACGGEEAPSGGSGGGEEVEIVLTDFALEPASLSLEPGSYTLRVVNEGEAAHALEVDGPTGEVETETLAAGQSADLQVDLSEAGEYELYCPVGDHRDRGMEGAISVGGAGAGTTTDETTTEDDEGGYRY